MNIALHINQLLYSTNYVVIPEFGGFVCHDFRAEINTATQMFVPPSKKVSFQPALLDHDGTLLNFIAEKENVSLESAKTSVRAIVSKWLLDLSEGNHVKLEGIGRIYKDQYGDYGFQADVNANYDTSSFGLGIFRFPALQEESKSRSVLKIASSPKVVSNFGIWRSAAVVIGIVGLLYIGTQKTDFEKFNVAGINPMIFSSSNTEIVTDIPNESTSSEVIEIHATPVAEKVEEEIVSIQVTEDSNIDYTIEAVEIDKPFHIIVGAFKVEDNAKKLQRKLNAKGYGQAQYFYEKGLFRLSIDQFDNRIDATDILRKVQVDVQKSAWIYKK